MTRIEPFVVNSRFFFNKLKDRYANTDRQIDGYTNTGGLTDRWTETSPADFPNNSLVDVTI